MQLNISEERAKEILAESHVHICIPCYGGMVTEGILSSMLRFQLLAQQYQLQYTVDTMINESLVTRARNNLTAKMMTNEKSTHLLFIDADIRFNAEDIIKLLLRDKDIVGGAYPAKKEPVFYVINKEVNPTEEGDLVEVRHLGTGFLMIKREVFSKLFELYPTQKYKDSLNLGKQYEENMYNIFDTLVSDTGVLLSEDWVFCERARKAKYNVWCDTSIQLDHIGYHTFKGDISKLNNITIGLELNGKPGQET